MTKTRQNNNSSLQKVRVDFFFKGLTRELSRSIDTEVISPLSNMLALHFTHLDTNELQKTLSDIVARIRRYLGMRVVVIYDFAIVITLFSIATAKDDVFYEDVNENLKEAGKREEILLELVSNYEDKKLMDGYKKFIQSLLQEEDASLIINYIHSNESIAHSTYEKFYKSGAYKTRVALNKAITQTLRSYAQKRASYEELRNFLNMIFSILIAAIASYACIVQFGIFGPFLVLPVTLYGIKYSLYPVDKLLEHALNLSSEVRLNARISKVQQNIHQQNMSQLAHSPPPANQTISDNKIHTSTQRQEESIDQIPAKSIGGSIDQVPAQTLEESTDQAPYKKQDLSKYSESAQKHTESIKKEIQVKSSIYIDD
ncbi:MAG: hypothetical protein EB127_06515 [Alphaproteobacteria bacterium]|nr:hypothetical protein [Alphaproteobacteria bacterium]